MTQNTSPAFNPYQGKSELELLFISFTNIAMAILNRIDSGNEQLQLQKSIASINDKVKQIENKIEKRMNPETELQIVTPTQLGKHFEPIKSAQQVNKLLKAAGLQYKVGREWIPTQKGQKYSSASPQQLESGKYIFQLCWQRKVIVLLK